MKIKDFKDIKSKELKDLKKVLSEKKKDAAKKRMEIFSGKDKNLKLSKNLRKDIAQILTLIREKEIMEKLNKKV